MGRRNAAAVSRERELLVAARNGDAVAFGELYRCYLGDVREFCARRISDRLLAEDLAQDTFVKAFEQIGAFQIRAPFWPWLSTIARNLCIDELRRRRRAVEESSAALPEPAGSPADPTCDEALAEDTRRRVGHAVTAALETLGARDRRLVWDRTVTGMTWEEVASAERSSVHSARNAAWRARAILRSALAGVVQDLRSWVAVWIGAAALRMRKTASRVQSVVVSWTTSGEVVLERLTEAVVVTILSVGLIGAATAAAAATPATPVSAVSRARPASTALPKPATVHTHRGHATAGGLAGVTTTTDWRPNAPLPAHGHYRIEVRGPDGRLLLWSDTTMDCGDGRPADLLPRGAPVRAYC